MFSLQLMYETPKAVFNYIWDFQKYIKTHFAVDVVSTGHMISHWVSFQEVNASTHLGRDRFVSLEYL